MNPVVNMQEMYPYAPELVWEALTDRTEISQWLMKTDFVPNVGQEFQFTYDPGPGWRGYVDCKVLEVDPPKRLAYSWSSHDGNGISTVTWTMQPVEGGTLLTLEHTGFTGENWQKEYDGVSGGWPKHLKLIHESLQRLSVVAA